MFKHNLLNVHQASRLLSCTQWGLVLAHITFPYREREGERGRGGERERKRERVKKRKRKRER